MLSHLLVIHGRIALTSIQCRQSCSLLQFGYRFLIWRSVLHRLGNYSAIFFSFVNLSGQVMCDLVLRVIVSLQFALVSWVILMPNLFSSVTVLYCSDGFYSECIQIIMKSLVFLKAYRIHVQTNLFIQFFLLPFSQNLRSTYRRNCSFQHNLKTPVHYYQGICQK